MNPNLTRIWWWDWRCGFRVSKEGASEQCFGLKTPNFDQREIYVVV